MTYLYAWLLVAIAISLFVGIVLPVCSALYTSLRKRRASRLAAEAEDTDETVAWLREVGGMDLPDWQAAWMQNVTPLPGRRLAAVPEQRTGDAPYDVEAEGGL